MISQKTFFIIVFIVCCFVAGCLQTKQAAVTKKLQTTIYENEFVDYVKVPINDLGDFRIVYNKDIEFVKQVRKGRQIFRESIY